MSQQTDTPLSQRSHHVVVALAGADKQPVFHVTDMRQHLPVIKPLGLMAAAQWPDHEGEEWILHLRLIQPASGDPILVAEAHLPSAGPGDTALAWMAVPCSAFLSVAQMIAAQCELQLEAFTVRPVPPDSPLLETWEAAQEDEDFEFVCPPSCALTLPSDFSRRPPPATRRVVEPVDSWTRCVFCPEAFETFLRADHGETQTEQHWVGLGRIHLADGLCYNVTEQIVSVVGEATRFGIRTRGDDWASVLDLYGDRIVSYLHTHPPDNGQGIALTCDPSGNDLQVMHNVNLNLPSRPIVSAIALWGTTPEDCLGRVAAYAYDRHGVMSRVQLEICQ